mmetsp:Transcript_24278/g.37442  ORF Transcript_24278/g.37442 Transcript_24278/m.37442 type:complete len:123 (+) Transcript_24278:1604-1972(+)
MATRKIGSQVSDTRVSGTVISKISKASKFVPEEPKLSKKQAKDMRRFGQHHEKYRDIILSKRVPISDAENHLKKEESDLLLSLLDHNLQVEQGPNDYDIQEKESIMSDGQKIFAGAAQLASR